MTARVLDWRHYTTPAGDFELPTYLYRVLMELMKSSLDLGVLLSSDPAKTRAFKEQLKSIFKKRWLEVAEALEAFGIIIPCGCPLNEYCSICGGSRYRLNYTITPDRLREIAVVTTPGADPEIAKKLQAGLERALEMVEGI